MNALDKIFLEDEFRSTLAKHNKLEKLKRTYLARYFISNPNSPQFWDRKIKFSETILIDPMTKDRINCAVNLIPKGINNLLDIGVGQGFFLKRLYKNKSRVEIFGIDISLHGLKEIRKRIKGKYLVGSTLSLPLKKKFDLVSVFEVFEHIPYYLIFTALREVKRVIKSGGLLLTSVPVNEHYTAKYNPNAHLRRYSKELFLAELKLGGFEVKKVKEFYAFNSFYPLKKFIAEYLLPKKWKPNVILVEAVAIK